MDLMARRRVMLAMEGQTTKNLYLWRSVEITKFESFNTFDDFKAAIVPDLPFGKTVVIIEFVNNTTNNRAGIGYVRTFLPNSQASCEGGIRVGGSFGGNYGCDVYAGCIVNIYVGEI